jgi:hypothetical protein
MRGVLAGFPPGELGAPDSAEYDDVTGGKATTLSFGTFVVGSAGTLIL